MNALPIESAFTRPPLPLTAHIQSAEIFFMGVSPVCTHAKYASSFRGKSVFSSRKLSKRELAPIRKIFSIRDIFLGIRNQQGEADIGLKLFLENGQEVEALVSMTYFWMSASSRYEERLLPLDPHVAFLLREAIRPIAPAGWSKEIGNPSQPPLSHKIPISKDLRLLPSPRPPHPNPKPPRPPNSTD